MSQKDLKWIFVMLKCLWERWQTFQHKEHLSMWACISTHLPACIGQTGNDTVFAYRHSFQNNWWRNETVDSHIVSVNHATCLCQVIQATQLQLFLISMSFVPQVTATLVITNLVLKESIIQVSWNCSCEWGFKRFNMQHSEFIKI